MTRNKNFLYILLATFVFVAAGPQALCASAESISVQALVDKQEVTVGESFLLQIKIDGEDSPAEPELSGLQDFAVQPKGGTKNNRESITIINGKINRVSEHGYIFQFELTPKRDGILTIPAIEIVANSKTLLTQPISIRVSKPLATEEFKLRLALSETECYVGQPLVLTVTWYVNSDIAEFQFNLPFLEDQRFAFDDLPEDKNYKGQDAIAINLSGGTVMARKGQAGLYGLKYTTVTLRRVLIPWEPGEFSLGRGSVVSKVVTGYRQNRGGPSDDFFNRNFFDDVFGRRQAVYKQLITESNDLSLNVLPLPDENRPSDFTGLVGEYSLAAEASPVEVNVGDPITLHIMVTGAEYLDNVVLPPLHKQPEMNGFKVPEEMGPGEIDGRVKTFTQTIRAKEPSVSEIPGISLNYFNPKAGKYESAKSNAIALKVNATRVVTARDAVGSGPSEGKSELTSLDKGIAHNYVGEDILINEHFEVVSWLSSPAGLAFVLFPPAVYLLLLVPLFIRRRRMLGADDLQAKKALHDFSREVAMLQRGVQQKDLKETAGRLVEVIRAYLGRRLHMPPGALVFADVAERLRNLGVDASLLAELQVILDWCEAYHYGAVDRSASGAESMATMLENTLTLFARIDQCFKK